jgi:hypothetical protein
MRSAVVRDPLRIGVTLVLVKVALLLPVFLFGWLVSR